MLPGRHVAPAWIARPLVGLALLGGVVGCSTPAKLPGRTPSPLTQLPNPSNAPPEARPAPLPTGSGTPSASVTPAGLPGGRAPAPAATQPVKHDDLVDRVNQPGLITPGTVPNNPAGFPASPAAPLTPPVTPTAGTGGGLSGAVSLTPPAPPAPPELVLPPTVKVIAPPAPLGAPK